MSPQTTSLYVGYGGVECGGWSDPHLLVQYPADLPQGTVQSRDLVLRPGAGVLGL